MLPRRVMPLADGLAGRAWLGPRTDSYAFEGWAILAVAAIVLPFLLQHIASARIEARIGAMKPQIIAAAQRPVGTPLQAIALLTDLLPDDTYLTLLGARQRKLAIAEDPPRPCG